MRASGTVCTIMLLLLTYKNIPVYFYNIIIKSSVTDTFTSGKLKVYKLFTILLYTVTEYCKDRRWSEVFLNIQDRDIRTL